MRIVGERWVLSSTDERRYRTGQREPATCSDRHRHFLCDGGADVRTAPERFTSRLGAFLGVIPASPAAASALQGTLLARLRPPRRNPGRCPDECLDAPAG